MSDMKNLPGLKVKSRSIYYLGWKRCITQYSHLIVKISDKIYLMRKVITNKSLGKLVFIYTYNDMNLGISLEYIRRRL